VLLVLPGFANQRPRHPITTAPMATSTVTPASYGGSANTKLGCWALPLLLVKVFLGFTGLVVGLMAYGHCANHGAYGNSTNNGSL